MRAGKTHKLMQQEQQAIREGRSVFRTTVSDKSKPEAPLFDWVREYLETNFWDMKKFRRPMFPIIAYNGKEKK